MSKPTTPRWGIQVLNRGRWEWFCGLDANTLGKPAPIYSADRRHAARHTKMLAGTTAEAIGIIFKLKKERVRTWWIGTETPSEETLRRERLPKYERGGQ